MCETLDLKKLKIEVTPRPVGDKMLALATIQLMEIRIKGFVIAEGPDRDTGDLQLYVTPPKASNRRPGKKQTEYFFLEDREKWKELQEMIIKKFEESESKKSISY
jgi:hypothetical protein